MIKKIFVVMLIVFSLVITNVSDINADEGELKLYATSAVLIDGSNGRVLYGKNENKVMPIIFYYLYIYKLRTQNYHNSNKIKGLFVLFYLCVYFPIFQ